VTLLLRIAEFIYGKQTRLGVFEPMIADWQNEVGAQSSFAVRVRWWCALLVTMARALPRVVFVNLTALVVWWWRREAPYRRFYHRIPERLVTERSSLSGSQS
jgi:hypothetical protein